eukprot:TRINITY_DN2267_c0_g2_i4.p1 TRINITY_DN2267_c0_g2~~TRINITY_DN2267_c0_g2_i4.p1  ORF type:complete len:560 (+),score=187.39 TRINITY_DN2267_c0_g2_i4:1738-3417(+)
MAVLMFYLTARAYREVDPGMESYFLAGRSAHWWVVGCSLFSYGTGVEFVIGMAVSGFNVGISAGFFLWGSIPPLLALSYYFLKEYRERDIITLPTFLFKPYNGSTRLIYALFVLMLSCQRISISLHYGAMLFEHLLGYAPGLTTTFMVAVASAIVLTGGLRAIIHIEVLQTSVMVPFSMVLMFEVFHRISLGDIIDQSPSNHSHLIHPADAQVDPWPGLVFGYPIEAMVYWCCSQVITQKALAARDDFNAKAGCIFCGVLNMITPFLFVLPGMAARVLFFDELQDAPYHTYEKLVKEFVPESCQGFLLAALACSVVTSVASALNTSSAIITLDIFERSSFAQFGQEFIMAWDKNMVIQKASIVCVALVGCAVSFLVPYFSSDQWNLRMCGNGYSAIVLAAFVSAAFFVWKVKPGVVSAMLVIGIALGLLRSVLETVDEDDLPSWIRWYATCSLYVLTAVSFVVYISAIVIISKLLTPREETRESEPQSEPPEESPTEVCSIVSRESKRSSQFYDDDETVVLGRVLDTGEMTGLKKTCVDVFAGLNLVLCVSMVIVWIAM